MSQSIDQDNGGASRVVLLATDRSQSILGEIVDGQTNTLSYSAYGEQSAPQKVETRLGFNGQLREASIGWYLLGNGYRAYNPRLMRFHSPDSWSPFGGGGLNAYMYCVGDPVNQVDPTGHNPLVAMILAAKDFKAPFTFHLPNYRAGAAPPKIEIGVAADAARALQSSRTFKTTHDLSALTSAAEYIGGKKPKVYWGNNGGEIHGVAAPRPQSSYTGAASVISGSRAKPPRAISEASRQNSGPTSVSPTSLGPPPSYKHATKLWNFDTLAKSMPRPTYQIYRMQVSPVDSLAAVAPYQTPARATPTQQIVTEQNRLMRQLGELNNLQRGVIHHRVAEANWRCRIL